MRCLNCGLWGVEPSSASLCPPCIEKLAGKAVEAERVIHKEKMDRLRSLLEDAERRVFMVEQERRDLMRLLANLTEKK